VRVPDQAGGFLDLGTRDPADRFDCFGRVAATQSRIKFEDRVADDLALKRCHRVLSIEREAGIAADVMAGSAVVRQ
jgi:hypothetical protein